MLGGLGSVILIGTLGRDDPGRSYLAGGLLLLSTLAFVALQVDHQRTERQRRLAGPRREYLHHLGRVRAAALEVAGQQRRTLTRLHPAPAALPELAAARTRVAERGPGHRAFLQVRYGVGALPLEPALVAPRELPVDADPVAVTALRRLVAVHGVQPGLPVCLDLRDASRVTVRGPTEAARSLCRAMVCAAATFHSPSCLAVAVLCPAPALGSWEWLKWLPHAHGPHLRDAAGPRRLAASTPDELLGLLPPGWLRHDGAPTAPGPGPRLLLVADGVTVPSGHPLWELGAGTTVLHHAGAGDLSPDGPGLELRLAEPSDPRGRHALTLHRVGQAPTPATADACDSTTAEAVARRLAQPRGGPGDGLRALLGPGAAVREPGRPTRLRVPIGVDEVGEPVVLDLAEAAGRGMGPHGLLVGATGSGKSELLRTLVLGLAHTHSPEQLALVLVDFKGGATFAGLSPLPHVSALITNLARDLTLVDRMQDALEGELVRRQELLRSAGDLASASEYGRARSAGADLAPLPALLVVVDECSELLAARPELLDLLTAIGRLGRSLGLHLLLASQRLDEGRLRGLESHLSYRICLRTFSAADSRSVLGVPDAAGLPPTPGLGLLRTGPDPPRRFMTTFVSRPAAESGPAGGGGIVPFTLAEVPPTRATGRDGETLLDAQVRRLSESGPRARRIWLPPLDRPETLGGLMPDLTTDPAAGLRSRRWRGRGVPTVPAGLVDRPRDQRREPLGLSLTGAAGHLGVVGGPRSGKSTLLRTVVAGLALTTTPQESTVLLLDLGGGALAPLVGLPHVTARATRAEPDLVRTVTGRVQALVGDREAGRDLGAQTYLVVDGWATVVADHPDLEATLLEIAARGLAVGVHLLVTAPRWADLRAPLRDLLGTRLELRLGDPLDSAVDRRAAALVPADRPGRGLTPEGLHFLAALPCLEDPGPDPAAAEQALVRRVAEAWRGPRPQELTPLPRVVTLAEVRRSATARTAQLLVGLEERHLDPVGLDVDGDPHLLVLGDGRSGRTAALREYLHEVIRLRTCRQAQVVVVDYRCSLLGEVPGDYLLHHLATPAAAHTVLHDLAEHLSARLPVSGAPRWHRAGRGGAEVFVVVDDYDLVVGQQGSPVAALAGLVPRAAEVGLQLVVARRSGGASRALHDPVLQLLRDLGAPGLLLPGSAEEGPLLGGLRPRPGPPGRGRLLTRDRGLQVVQVAWTEPASSGGRGLSGDPT